MPEKAPRKTATRISGSDRTSVRSPNDTEASGSMPSRPVHPRIVDSLIAMNPKNTKNATIATTTRVIWSA